MNRVLWMTLIVLAPICCCAGQLVIDRSTPRRAAGHLVRLPTLTPTPTPSPESRNSGDETTGEPGAVLTAPATPTGGAEATRPAASPVTTSTPPPTPSVVLAAPSPRPSPTATAALLPLPTPSATASPPGPSPTFSPTPRPPAEDDGDDDDDDDDDSRGRARPTRTATPPPTATPTAPPVPSPTLTSTPISTSTPTPTASATPAVVQISGRVFEDVDYKGGAGAAFGSGDAGLPNVIVELYDGSTLLQKTTTDGTGRYAFPGAPRQGTFRVRVVSTSIGDQDTKPAAGFNPGFTNALAEQTYESDGVSGNGGDQALGGNDPGLDDSTTAAGAGPGDTNVTVVVSGTDVTGLDFGFAFNLVANLKNTGQGSLRQVITNTNALSGTDTIIFNIAGSGPYTIQPDPVLPVISDPVVIDGATQPGFAGRPIVEIDGSKVSGPVAGLTISAGDSTVRNLVLNRFANGDGLDLTTKGNNVIQGNYLGLDTTGTTALSNRVGLDITDGSSNNRVGGTTPADRNVISGNSLANIFIQKGANDNTITGNYIGTDVAGDSALGGSVGIHIEESAANVIGGPTAAERNIISGNDKASSSNRGGRGVLLNTDAVSNTVQGNYIGVDVNLNPLGNKTGVYILQRARGNLIGGTAPGTANTIAYNSRDGGILINGDAGDSNQFRGNNIFDNVGLGINFRPGGVTPNDLGDGDGGPNDRLNFPVITSATRIGSDIMIAGFARPGSIIEFFIADPDPTGFGEGQTFLGVFVEGSSDDTDPAIDIFYDFGLPTGSDRTNRFSFTFTPAVSLKLNDQITATATDAAGNTSEFGPNESVN